MYVVQIQAVWTDARKLQHSIGLPTFYLNEHVQGITSVQHAREIAVHMLGSLPLKYEVEFHTNIAHVEGS